MQTLRIEKTVYPPIVFEEDGVTPIKDEPKIKPFVPYGVMIKFWEDNGNFNDILYKRISLLHTTC
jgi:hypothetical protein